MLTSKQRAQLRKMANGLDSIFQVGKGGLCENQIKQINETLEKRELIKLSVLDTAFTTAKDMCAEVCEQTGAEGVQIVGNKFVIYKQSKENKRIILEK